MLTLLVGKTRYRRSSSESEWMEIITVGSGRGAGGESGWMERIKDARAGEPHVHDRGPVSGAVAGGPSFARWDVA